MVLRVEDDGAGARLEDLPASEGVGLSNVRRRLVATYGSDQELTIEAAPDDGFAVRGSVPFTRSTLREPAA